MTFNEIMNSPLLYALVGAGIVYILIFCVITLRKAYRHGLEIGLTKDKLKTAITSSAIYSIVPSISIVIGLFSLAAVLGVPWSWFRLSVVGSVTYELMAADIDVYKRQANEPAFESPIINANEPCVTKTVYRFKSQGLKQGGEDR